MTDEPLESSYGSFAGEAEELAALTSDHPQSLHTEKLKLGIEEMAPGMVALRRMGDIQALNRSHDVRQFGSNMGLLEGESGEAIGLSGRHVAIPLELDGAEHTKWRKILDPVFTPKKMALLEPRVRERASELIDGFVDRGEVDAYLEWCEPLRRRSSCRSWASRSRSSRVSSRSRTRSSAVRSIRRSRPRRGWRRSTRATRGSPPTSTAATHPATTARISSAGS